MDELKVVAEIPEPPIFLCGEVVRCEVSVVLMDPKTTWEIQSIEGILVGQYRLNSAAVAEDFKNQPIFDKVFSASPDKDAKIDSEFIPGLDSQSRISWIQQLNSTNQWPLIIYAEKPIARIILKTRLSENLPPSYRGNIVRFAYKALIKVQVDNRPAQLLRLPFHILPSVGSYHSFDSTTADSLPGLSSNAYSESQSPPDCVCNPFHVDFHSQIGYKDSNLGEGILKKDLMHPAVYDKLSQLHANTQVPCAITSVHMAKKTKKRAKRTSFSQSPSAMFAEIVFSSSIVSFMLSGPNGHICRIGMFKTVARLGDLLRGYLDFRMATLPTFECIIWADTDEFLDPTSRQETNLENNLLFSTLPIDIPTASKDKVLRLPENALKTSWFEARLACSNTKFLPFAIPIPLNAPVEFMLSSKYWGGLCRVQWCLRFQFTVAMSNPRQQPQLSTEPSLFNNFLQGHTASNYSDYTPSINCDTQTFSWELPICIIPNGPSAFLLPNQTCSSCTFSRG
nr:retrograde Golgi transport protein RGP1 [Echinococcus granulosus]